MSSELDCAECGGFIDLERSDNLCRSCLENQRAERADDMAALRVLRSKSSFKPGQFEPESESEQQP